MRLEELVELFVVVMGEVNRFLLFPVLAVYDQVGVVVEDPLDLDVRILVDTAPLLEEPLDAGQPIQPSRIAGDDLARLVRCPDRAKQCDEGEWHMADEHFSQKTFILPPCILILLEYVSLGNQRKHES